METDGRKLTFEEICKLDPMVLGLLQEASAFRVLFEDGRVGRIWDAERAAKLQPDPNFCRTQLWRALPRARGEVGLLFLLKQRVGYGTKSKGPGARPELATEEAYTICYRKICDAMPACQHTPGKEWTLEGPEYPNGVTHGQENMCIYDYPVPAATRTSLSRQLPKTGFYSLVDELRHMAGTAPEPEPVPGTGEDWKEWRDKLEPANEPVYIVRAKPETFTYTDASGHTLQKTEMDGEKWRLWYTLIDERYRAGKLSKWYAGNCIFSCDDDTRAKLLGLTKLELSGALLGRPLVLTFKDEELARKLSTVCREVLTVENPQSVDEVYKEISKYVPLPEISTEEERLPEFPRLPGPLGKLVDAITQDLAYDHKALAVLTYVGIGLANRVRLTSDRWLQTRFYSCMVGPPGSGKSAPDIEARTALFEIKIRDILGEADDEGRCVLPDVNIEMSIDSGPALVQALGDLERDHGVARMILAPDELADQFEKAKITGTGKNSLFGEFLKLYESNKTANHTKAQRDERTGKVKSGGLMEVKNALFAIIGSVTTTRFEAMWNGAGGVSSGLQSRFVYSYSEKVPPRVKTPNDDEAINGALVSLADIVTAGTENTFMLSLSEAAQSALYNWRALESDADETKIRIVDMAKRFAMLVAACNRQTVIDEATMRLGLAFADYEIAVRTKLCPPDSASNAQAFENSLLKFYGRNPRATKPQAVRNIRPETRRGGYAAFNQAFDALVKAGKLVAYGKTRKGETVWGLA